MQEKTQGQELEAEKQKLLHEREQLCQQLQSAKEKVHSLQASLNLVGGSATSVQVTCLEQPEMCNDICTYLESADLLICLKKQWLQYYCSAFFQPQIALLSKQLAAVEMRELAEKQKAEHAAVMYQTIKSKKVDLFLVVISSI